MSGTRAETMAGPAAGSGPPTGALMGGALIGYARAADSADDAEPRVRALREAGCGRVYTDGTPDRQAGQPELRACLESLRPTDTLVVASLDQLGRSQRELIARVEEVRRSGAGFRSLHEGLDTTTPGGDAIFRVFSGLADFGRTTIATGTSDGLAAARARGKRLGRPPALTPEQLREVRALLHRPEHTISSIAKTMGVSRSTLYKYLPDISHTDADGLPALEIAGYSHGQPSEPSTVAAHLAPYQARPGRRVLVIDDLADLLGPTTGSVELPLRLFWSLPDHRFDLDDPDMRLWYYQTVLREASRPADITTHLDGGTLVSIWPDLYVPKGVRRAWEEQHPALRAEVTA
jgi:DNA invertase Pin-like site-specific DNA recombinase